MVKRILQIIKWIKEHPLSWIIIVTTIYIIKLTFQLLTI